MEGRLLRQRPVLFEISEVLTEHLEALAALDVGAAGGSEFDEDGLAALEGFDGFRTAVEQSERAAEEGEGFGDFSAGSGIGGVALGEFLANAEGLTDLLEGRGAIALAEEGLGQPMARGGEHGEAAHIVGVGGHDLLVDADGFAECGDGFVPAFLAEKNA